MPKQMSKSESLKMLGKGTKVIVDFGGNTAYSITLVNHTTFVFFGNPNSSFLDVVNTSLSAPSFHRSNLFSSSLSPMLRLKFEVLASTVGPFFVHMRYFSFGMLGKRTVGLQATSSE